MADHAREGPALSPKALAQRRRRTAAVVLAGFCAFLALYAPQPLLPLLAVAFGKTAAAISFTVTVSTIAVAVAAPLAGAAADRLADRSIP